jgi:hypothetical protein
VQQRGEDLSTETRAFEHVKTAGKILDARQLRPVTTQRERRELRWRPAERQEVALDELGASAQRKPERRRRGREPRHVDLDGDVEAVERLEHAAIPMHVEAGIEQPELGLEVLMHGRGLALQASPQ